MSIKTNIHEYTLMNDFIKGKRDIEICDTQANYWYKDLPNEIPTTESIIDLGYNGKLMSLLTFEASIIEENVNSISNQKSETY